MARSPSKFIDLIGEPILVRYALGLRDTAGNQAHAATFIRERRIMLDRALLRSPAEHSRILVHEIFHFAWVRLGNRRRSAWEELLVNEWNLQARGEAGWSAEWRKDALTHQRIASRSRLWREYCCEAFCDTAAVVYTGPNAELTLRAKWLKARTQWFERNLGSVAYI